MARISYVHWNEEEARETVRALETAGNVVEFHFSTYEHLRMGDFQPEAFVISIDRLPSHGKAIAEWFWESKKRRAIPLIFAGGKPDKVEAMKTKFPGATYCDSDKLVETVERLVAQLQVKS